METVCKHSLFFQLKYWMFSSFNILGGTCVGSWEVDFAEGLADLEKS